MYCVIHSRDYFWRTIQRKRDTDYDLMVLLGEGDEDHATGEAAEIEGIVESSRVVVYLRRID